MSSLGNIVKFLHFTGTLAQWDSKINSGAWEASIVFGIIYDENNVEQARKIYAGKDSRNTNYIFDFANGQGNLISKTFSTYLQAELYLTTDNAVEGQLVSVTSGNGSGNYIILRDIDTNSLVLSTLNNVGCKWSYGNSDDWHTENAVITNTIGNITEGMTLKELMDATEGGELSRIIEKMLFSSKLPTINAIVEIDGNSPQRQFIVSVNTTGLPTTTTVYVNTIKSRVNATTYQNPTGPITVSGNEPNTTYYVMVESTNEVGTTSLDEWKEITTSEYVEPVVTMPTITVVNKPGTNNATISVTAPSINSGDYDIDNTTKTYLLFEEGSSTPIATGLENINTTVLDYGKTYIVKVSFDAAYADGTGGNQTFVTESDPIVINLPSTGSLTINSVEGAAYNNDTTYTILDDDLNIIFSAVARLSSAIATVTLNNNTIGTYNTNSGVISNQEIIIPKTSLGDAGVVHQVSIVLSDDYGTINTKIIKANYLSNKPNVSILVEAGDNTHRDAKVTFSVNGEDITSKTLYVCTSQNKSAAVQNYTIGTGETEHTFNNLTPGTKYYFAVEAINNGGTSIDWCNMTMESYILPTGTIAMDLIPTGTSNYLKLDYAESNFVITYGNDYESAGNITYTLNGANKTFDELIGFNYEYDESYTIIASKPTKLIDGSDTTVYSIEKTFTKTVASTASTIVINKVDNESYNQADEPYEISNNSLSIQLTATPGIYNATITYYINDIQYGDTESITSESIINKTFSNLNPDENNQTISIKIADEYNEASAAVIFNYQQTIITYVGTFSAIGNNTDEHVYMMDFNDGTPILEETVTPSMYGSTPEEIIENSLDATYDVAFGEDPFVTAQTYNFFITASANSLTDIETLSTTTVNNKTYYTYNTPDSKNTDQGFIYVLIPDGYTVEFYNENTEHAPLDYSAPTHKSTITTTYNGAEYYVYYMTQTDGSHIYLSSSMNIFITKDQNN